MSPAIKSKSDCSTSVEEPPSACYQRRMPAGEFMEDNMMQAAASFHLSYSCKCVHNVWPDLRCGRGSSGPHRRR